MQFTRQPSRVALFGLVSSTVASAVLLHAFSLHSWYFYPACIYISRSSACMMALMNFALFVGLMFGRGVQKVVFGELRAVEVEHLYERSWLAVTETLLAMTIFRDEFDSKFMILFAALMMLKAFHWICADRVDFIEQSPVTQISFHIKLASFMCFLFGVDTAFSTHAVQIIMDKGPNVMLLFGFEYTILSSTMVVTFAKYILHILDMRREEPWENKSVWIFYIEMAHDFFKLVNYIVFFSLILAFYGLPIHIIRDLYLTLRSFLVKVRDLIRYRQATRNMDQRYPNATADDLNRLSDRTCIICREDMWAEGEVRPAEDERPVGNQQRRGQIPKKLPCGHIFHFSCLRSWLERQQSCPTCRRPVLENNNNRGPQVQPVAQQQARPAQPPNAPIRPNAAQQAAPMNQGVFPPVAGPPFNPFVIPANQAPQNQANSPAGSTNSTSPTTVSATSSNRRITISFRPPVMNNAAPSGSSTAATPPQPPMFLPYMFPMPPLAPHGSIPNLPQQPVLTHLTDEQLQSFLSTTLDRNTLEERIRTLQRVQNQLHGCITAMTQIASTLDVNLHNARPPVTSAPAPSTSSTSSSIAQSNSGASGSPTFNLSSSRDTGSTTNRQFSASITFNTSRPNAGVPTSRSPGTSPPSSTTSRRESGGKEPTESNKSTSTTSDQTSPGLSKPPPYSSLPSSDVATTSQIIGGTSPLIPPSSTSVHSSKPSPWSQQPGTTGSSSSYLSSGGSSSTGSSFTAGYTLGTPPNATAPSVGSNKSIIAEKDDAENGASSSSSDRKTESGDQISGN
ncbi:hypothetical protein BKA69DRAFT_1063400 [Paraphysoderma sedebokerense]|nr:hypothetical protein BKA69DRAFT_1063400 [Paraphysoderma sedebokerense]